VAKYSSFTEDKKVDKYANARTAIRRFTVGLTSQGEKQWNT
jgi:hypothetical protein